MPAAFFVQRAYLQKSTFGTPDSNICIVLVTEHAKGNKGTLDKLSRTLSQAKDRCGSVCFVVAARLAGNKPDPYRIQLSRQNRESPMPCRSHVAQPRPTITTMMMSSSIPGARNNNLVAESDLVAALSAIEQRLEPDAARSVQKLLQACTQPVSDEAYHTFVYEQTTTTHDTPKNIDSDEIVIHDDEFEEDELLDVDLWKRLQDQREKLRTDSARMQQLRQRVLAQAVQLTERQVNLWKNEQEHQCSSSQEDATAIEYMGDLQEKMSEMQACLDKMKENLNETAVLPDKLNSLKETVAAIEAKMSSSLSQVEAAIVMRDNEGSKKRIIKGDTEEEVLANLLRN